MKGERERGGIFRVLRDGRETEVRQRTRSAEKRGHLGPLRLFSCSSFLALLAKATLFIDLYIYLPHPRPRFEGFQISRGIDKERGSGSLIRENMKISQCAFFGENIHI